MKDCGLERYALLFLGSAIGNGVSRPSTGIYRRSPVGMSYDAFDTERYMLTFENRTLRDIAANAPYDVVEILTNSETYGGGGIFNQYATVAIDNLWAGYVGVHEFGHHFAGSSRLRRAECG